MSDPLVQRLRDIINKGLTNEELLRGVQTAWERGWRQIKLCAGLVLLAGVVCWPGCCC